MLHGKIFFPKVGNHDPISQCMERQLMLKGSNDATMEPHHAIPSKKAFAGCEYTDLHSESVHGKMNYSVCCNVSYGLTDNGGSHDTQN